MLTVRRSPAKVAWWVVCNGITVDVCPTKQEAEESKAILEKLL